MAKPDVRWLFLALSNAGATFLLCLLLLGVPGPAGIVVFDVGLAVVPAVTAAVMARSSRVVPSSTAASVAYFALLFAVGVAIELATIWLLLEIFWRGPQLGA